MAISDGSVGESVDGTRHVRSSTRRTLANNNNYLVVQLGGREEGLCGVTHGHGRPCLAPVVGNLGVGEVRLWIDNSPPPKKRGTTNQKPRSLLGGERALAVGGRPQLAGIPVCWLIRGQVSSDPQSKRTWKKKKKKKSTRRPQPGHHKPQARSQPNQQHAPRPDVDEVEGAAADFEESLVGRVPTNVRDLQG